MLPRRVLACEYFASALLWEQKHKQTRLFFFSYFVTKKLHNQTLSVAEETVSKNILILCVCVCWGGGVCVCWCYSWHFYGFPCLILKYDDCGENCLMEKLEMMERVKCMLLVGALWHPWREWGGAGVWGCESLGGMGSGILLVMYYTLRGLGKGVGVGVLGLSACQHSHCAKAGVRVESGISWCC